MALELVDEAMEEEDEDGGDDDHGHGLPYDAGDVDEDADDDAGADNGPCLKGTQTPPGFLRRLVYLSGLFRVVWVAHDVFFRKGRSGGGGGIRTLVPGVTG